jgi:hypothetical protein
VVSTVVNIHTVVPWHCVRRWLLMLHRNIMPPFPRWKAEAACYKMLVTTYKIICCHATEDHNMLLITFCNLSQLERAKEKLHINIKLTMSDLRFPWQWLWTAWSLDLYLTYMWYNPKHCTPQQLTIKRFPFIRNMWKMVNSGCPYNNYQTLKWNRRQCHD